MSSCAGGGVAQRVALWARRRRGAHLRSIRSSCRTECTSRPKGPTPRLSVSKSSPITWRTSTRRASSRMCRRFRRGSPRRFRAALAQSRRPVDQRHRRRREDDRHADRLSRPASSSGPATTSTSPSTARASSSIKATMGRRTTRGPAISRWIATGRAGHAKTAAAGARSGRQ